MDIDIYQQCPCYSGKKIKFCCGKDIVAELKQIVSKFESNQALSALDQIDRVIAKQGEKDCLLTLKAHILFTTGEIDKAAEVNQLFIARQPDHPIGRQNEALTALAKGDIPTAIDKLQDAMDLIQGEIPIALANTFRMLGAVLLSAGHLIAARAHLQFSLMIRNEIDEEVQRMLQESFRMPGAPLVLKTDFRLDQVNSDQQWHDKYEIVVGALNRGQFRLALKMLNRMNEHWPNQPSLVRGLAVVNSMLANEDEMSSAWRNFAMEEGVPKWQAIEAECLSQIFLPSEPTGNYDIVTRKFTITDFDECHQSALASKRLEASEPPAEDPFGEGPAPRQTFFVLDRDKIQASDDLKPEDIPLVVGEILLYGKQTDREPRLVLLATRKEPAFEETIGYLKETLEINGGGEASEEIVSGTSIAADTLTWNWKMPAGIDIEKHKSLIVDYRRKVILQDWANLKFSCLNDLTPLEAKDSPELAIPLAAVVANLEQSSMLQLSAADDIADLRKELGLPEPEVLDATELTDDYLSPMRARQIDPKTLSDDQMVRVYADSVSIGNTAVLKKVLPEILDRDSLATKIPREITYSMLAQLADDNDKAIQYIQLARHEAKTNGGNVGVLLVQEFEIRLSRGITDKLPELLKTLQKQYLQDPNVEYQLARVLSKFGLISPDGRTVSLPTSNAQEESSSGSKIWTPDSDEEIVGAGSESDGSGGSKIWVPGSD